MYRLLNPASGAQTFAVGWGYDNATCKMSCISITKASTYYTEGDATGSGTLATVTTNVKANGIMIGFLVTMSADSPLEVDTEVTALTDAGDNLHAAYTLTAADGTDSISWTDAAGMSWREVAVSFYTA